MDDLKDYITALISRSIDIIFVKAPLRTGLGIFIGGTLKFISILFGPVLEKTKLIDVHDAPLYGWVSLGILICHLGTLWHLFSSETIGDESIDQAIQLIERGTFSKVERRQQYRNLIARVLKNLSLEEKLLEHIERMESELKNASLYNNFVRPIDQKSDDA